MMKQKTLTIIAVTIGLLLVVVLAFVYFQPLAAEDQSPVVVTEATLGSIENNTVNKETSDVVIAAAYPTVGIDLLDTTLRQFVADTVSRFEVEVGGIPRIQFAPHSLDITYKIDRFDQQFLSILFSISVYTGGAHPNTVLVSKTFDVTTGKLVELADMFAPGAVYVPVLSQRATADLAQLEYAVEDWIQDGAGPKAENFSAFTLSTSTLMLHFSPYQVAAYAAGSQHVAIPFADLAGLLRSDIAQ